VEKKEIFIKSIQENEKLIYKVASFYTDCKEDRDDLMQEIIYSLWKSFDSFKHNSSLSTWMYRIAMNVAIFHLKKDKRKVATISIDVEVLNFPEIDFDDFEEKLHNLQQYIKDLNLLDKGILMLYLESKSHEEIAEIVGISKSNVATKLFRIKDKLRLQVSTMITDK
jgi:RNA polymerase sigma factor (sigma-70 family)